MMTPHPIFKDTIEQHEKHSLIGAQAVFDFFISKGITKDEAYTLVWEIYNVWYLESEIRLRSEIMLYQKYDSTVDIS